MVDANFNKVTATKAAFGTDHNLSDTTSLRVEDRPTVSTVVGDFVATPIGDNHDTGALRAVGRNLVNQGSGNNNNLRAHEVQIVNDIGGSGSAVGMELGVHNSVSGKDTKGMHIHSSHTGWLPTGARNDIGIYMGGEDGWNYFFRCAKAMDQVMAFQVGGGGSDVDQELGNVTLFDGHVKTNWSPAGDRAVFGTKTNHRVDFTVNNQVVMSLNTNGTITNASGQILGASSGGSSPPTFSSNTCSFKALMPGHQPIAPNTITKVRFDNEEFDTNNTYDVGNKRHVPTVAGVYFYEAQVLFDPLGDASAKMILEIRKNNVPISKAQVSQPNIPNSASSTLKTSTLIPMNGSTDFIEVFVHHNDIGNNNVTGDATHNHLSGYRVGS